MCLVQASLHCCWLQYLGEVLLDPNERKYERPFTEQLLQSSYESQNLPLYVCVSYSFLFILDLVFNIREYNLWCREKYIG